MKIGTGWIGWTEDQTLETSMPAIILAYEGRVDMMRSIFGGDPPPADNQKSAGMIKQLAAMKKAHDKRKKNG